MAQPAPATSFAGTGDAPAACSTSITDDLSGEAPRRALFGALVGLPAHNHDIWRDLTDFGTEPSAWLNEFQSFEDKSGAINLDTGKTCLYDEAVMELMWGLKNLMRSLVPKEKSQLTKEERLQMSQGLNILLKRYGFDVKPEMVNDRIIEAACWLYDCNYCEKIHSKTLRRIGKLLKDISNIDTRDWDLLKFAIALMTLCPTMDYTIGDYQKMFSIVELSKLVVDKHK
ncbi:hypothetical protein E2562_026155 [Oryza meyeriana var. granulata]|uniref:Uncharacterized protein n=1 Tax=Oryza meyeriana var. granulata TaxID=110450 RepID=A0A6G1E2Y3_9ORYZ|nr:hypothetical protein E2562_026155 [Oryza meyeriana var. granulata]